MLFPDTPISIFITFLKSHKKKILKLTPPPYTGYCGKKISCYPMYFRKKIFKIFKDLWYESNCYLEKLKIFTRTVLVKICNDSELNAIRIKLKWNYS